MNNAIIIAAGRGINNETLSTVGGVRVGGIPQLKRLIITAQRAGITNFTIIIDNQNVRLKDNFSKENIPNIRITWHLLGTEIELEAGPYLIVQANVIINHVELERLLHCEVGEHETAILVDKNKTKISKEMIGVFEEEEFADIRLAVGLFITHGNIIVNAVLNSMNLANWLRELSDQGNIKYLRCTDDYFTYITPDKESVSEAEKLLFTKIRKSERGWMSRNINRRISIQLSKFLIHTSLTPNLISVAVGFIGILSGCFYALGRPILGGVLLEVSSILDGCDGEVAKMKLMESKVGQWIDTIFDQLSYIAFIIGAPLGYYLSTGNPVAIVLGVINLGLLILSVFWGVYFLSNYADSGSFVSYPAAIDKLVPITKRNSIYLLIYKVRPLLQREYMAFIILIASIIGGYILVLSLTTLVLSLTAVHLIDDFIMTNKLKASAENLVSKIQI